MSDVEDDLRTTSDTILAATDRLTTLEKEKRTLGPEDEERVDLSAEIAKIGRRLEQATAAESELAVRAANG
jgi:hypothetical protein